MHDDDPRVAADELRRLGILELVEMDRRMGWQLIALAVLVPVVLALLVAAILAR